MAEVAAERRVRLGSPASASSRRWAKGRRRIGRVSTRAPGPADAATWAPFVIHPLAALDLDKQIPKKGDQRQMEAWQRIGTYAAGLALDSAGVKGNAELLARMDMIVAAGGGERDAAVDATILSGLRKSERPGRLPQRAADERSAADIVSGAALEPAGRQHFDRSWRHRLLAHVHGRGIGRRRRGPRRACAHRRRPERDRAGGRRRTMPTRSPRCCSSPWVTASGGASFARCGNGRRPAAEWRLGSLGAFLVMEESEHAAGARRDAVRAPGRGAVGTRQARSPARSPAMLDRLVGDASRRAAARPGLRSFRAPTGAEPATAEERAFLAARAGIAVRATGSHLGHGVEAQFPMNIALAAIALRARPRCFPPSTRPGFERAMDAPLRQVAVTSVGHWRGEGLALLEAVR